MSRLSRLSQIVRADFMERTRRYGTLILLGAAIFLTYSYLPPADADYVTFSMNGYRGIYNSAWVGGTVTVLCVRDQSALHGVLERVRDLNLVLIALKRVEYGKEQADHEIGNRQR